jgi:hypothetical protein
MEGKAREDNVLAVGEVGDVVCTRGERDERREMRGGRA